MVGVAAEQAAHDELVHRQIGLVQPEAAHIGRRKAQALQMVFDVFGRHRADFLEHFAAFLAKELVAVVGVAVFGARHKTLVVADVVGKGAEQTRAQNFECASRRQVQALDQDGGAHVAKNKVAIAVFPGQMRRGDFRVHHQHRPRLAGAHGVIGQFNRKSGRGAGHVHVKGVALDAQRGLDFHAHGGVGALHIGGRTDQSIHVGSGFAGGSERVLACFDADFGHQ